MGRSKNQKIVRNAIVIVAIAVIALVGIVFALVKQREKQHLEELLLLQEEARPKIEEPVIEETEKENVPIDFEEIRKSNPDIIAWINVPGTDVDYPILQSSKEMEEDYYLTHNMDGSAGYPGCIYVQKLNSADFSDYVSVVYGHNMKDGSMFSSLHNYEDADFFFENREFAIYTPEEVKHYEIVAALYYDDRLIPAYYNNFESSTDVIDFLNELYSRDSRETDHYLDYQYLDLEKDYVVLSTCAVQSNERYLVIGMSK